MSKDEDLKLPSKSKIKFISEYQSKYEEFILKHHDMFSKNDQDIRKAEYLEHNILLNDTKPRFKKQYPIPDAHRPSMEAQIQDWLKMGIIQPSTYRYNSPMFMVPKRSDPYMLYRTCSKS